MAAGLVHKVVRIRSISRSIKTLCVNRPLRYLTCPFGGRSTGGDGLCAELLGGRAPVVRGERRRDLPVRPVLELLRVAAVRHQRYRSP